jgi:hypothetical protein
MPYQGVPSCHQASDPLPETAVLRDGAGSTKHTPGVAFVAVSVVYMHRNKDTNMTTCCVSPALLVC